MTGALRAAVRRGTSAAAHRLADEVGGRARGRIVGLLAAVIALDGADKATVSINAGSIESVFGVGHTKVGLLISLTALSGAVFTLPAGVLTDRVDRTRLLTGSILLWCVATVFAGGAMSYLWLVLSRIALGAVTASAGPGVASLMGDYFPASERARLYGFVLAGELVGTGIGYVVSTNVSALVGWRYSFTWLALPGLALAWAVWRLPEPPRGGGAWLPAGDGSLPDGVGRRAPGNQGAAPQTQAATAPPGSARQIAAASDSEPYPDRVLREDPSAMSVGAALRYVLRIRTVVLIIVASGLGMFFFAGVRTFALLYVTEHYDVGKSTASGLTLVLGGGMLAGLMIGSRAPDWALRRGHAGGRVLVPSLALLAAPIALAPGLAIASPLLALPLLSVGGALLASANPPLDAARLDIVPAGLWGRAEGVRTVVRSGGEFAAPVLFGATASALATGGGRAAGLEPAILLALLPLFAAGLIGLLALRTYPRDVATALASTTAGDRPPPDSASPESAPS
ncbi:MFS transporter [Streptomyces sp. NPDC006265]|uniref:MFS transporter n=1 Tax=Streptomyces sp. NPDC006265 TaxID=3156740 RepID=UPI0033AE3AB8